MTVLFVPTCSASNMSAIVKVVRIFGVKSSSYRPFAMYVTIVV